MNDSTFNAPVVEGQSAVFPFQPEGPVPHTDARDTSDLVRPSGQVLKLRLDPEKLAAAATIAAVGLAVLARTRR